MLIVDSHLDLAYNAIEYNRDLSQPIEAIRKSEADMSNKRRGANTVSLPSPHIAASNPARESSPESGPRKSPMQRRRAKRHFIECWNRKAS